MQTQAWDAVIIGGGAAGLMAAITCAGGGLRTLILEGNSNPGSKILISGGGRCNVTNLSVSEKDYQTGQPRAVRNILRAFPPEKTLEFFKTLGVEMVLEEDAKYFPKEQSAKVVLEALLRASRRAGAVLETGKKVRTVSKDKDLFRISGKDFEHFSKAVVIATGGLSYPGTGSDGSGYALAKSLGHTIVPTSPALTPLLTGDPVWKNLSGITLPVELWVLAGGAKLSRSKGALLFTHTGFSGPAALDISGPWLRCEAKDKTLAVNFFPARREAEFLSDWERLAVQHPDRSWKRALASCLPERLAEVLLGKHGIGPKARLDQVSRKNREAFLRALFRHPLPVSGAQGYEKAEVTAGGVDLGEVDPKTLESRCCPGLFFAGEVLDVDGRIGGFNFQWAWASGFVAGGALLRGGSCGQGLTRSGR